MTYQHNPRRSNSSSSYNSEYRPKAIYNGAKSRMPRRLFQFIKWFIFFTCGVLIFYSVVPWQAAGNAIGTAIVRLPIIGQLLTVPLLGLLMRFLVWILPNGMAVMLWALCQLIEITPVLLHDPEIYAATIKQLRAHEASQPSDHPNVEKFSNKMANYLVAIFRNIGVYAALAYIAELGVNIWYYLPYGNGWDDFIRDAWVWDASLIRWSEFFLMIGSIAIVEVLVLFILNVHRLFKAITPRTERRS